MVEEEQVAVATPTGTPMGTPERGTWRPPGAATAERDGLLPAAPKQAFTDAQPEAGRTAEQAQAMKGSRGSTAAISIFEAMDAHANKHKCAPLWHFFHYAFDPAGRFRVAWDTAILILVLWSCMKDPYETAFLLEGELREDPSASGMSVADWAVDMIFYFDMLLNFWTGYDTGCVFALKIMSLY